MHGRRSGRQWLRVERERGPSQLLHPALAAQPSEERQDAGGRGMPAWESVRGPTVGENGRRGRDREGQQRQRCSLLPAALVSLHQLWRATQPLAVHYKTRPFQRYSYTRDFGRASRGKPSSGPARGPARRRSKGAEHSRHRIKQGALASQLPPWQPPRKPHPRLRAGAPARQMGGVA